MEKLKIISVVGARPNFVKIAPLMREFEKHKGVENILVHTGQHYTDVMSDVFFRDFKIKRHIDLGVGPDTPLRQMVRIMRWFENVLIKEKPDLVIVVGDVNSTLACALSAVKLNIKVAHVEAGLRSFDRTMPEELNRALTDSISDYLFVTEPSGLKNLKNEGIPEKNIFFAGNIMIDSLVNSISQANKRNIREKLRLTKGQYAVLTLHRPSNVDDRKKLENILRVLNRAGKDIKIVYPIHPRTIKMLRQFRLWERLKRQSNMVLTEPLGYMDFLKLMMDSKFIITDSGGIQEETTYLGIPCFTLRKNTERPITVTQGTNRVIGDNYGLLLKLILRGPAMRGNKRRPKFWDGKTAARIVRVLMRALSG